ncbi:proteasome assembly chaperone family protein [Candidatus Woesearchaeota archaeon]|nr:proteasome assembly chaperone family protein [Candidatus Woesearchaeota archaeon]
MLKKKPKDPIVVEGFPGFGLVGTIASEFLISHLQCEKIGSLYFEDLPATIAIHEGAVIDPVSIYYNKKYNIVIIHSISGAQGIEWKAADAVLDICQQLGAKEIISLEGVGAAGMGDDEENDANSNAFFYSTCKECSKKLKSLGVEQLGEGIIMGVTSALVLKTEIPLTCLFAETHSNLPDSKAAAKMIEVLDKYLGLQVDYKPLLKQAEKFEEKLRGLIEKGTKAQEIKERKSMSYVG